ncbi:hypothetical protein FJ651_09570 [Paucihalobacter ruber]|uniref:Uncharacterized protein n=1 Tax=Paucihalobacter ruber TaxID=2567861 RepID=A0A506PM83_9FLAO|nr:hypothetical protein [Paucihalobacter ruber]TPV33330.1 hypothetical protein FJ651_09570 [Paucihalobacter ruber]
MGKYKKLALSLVLDFIGFITIFDVIWAPLSAYIMTRMYPGNKGKVAGVVSFIEEILPGLDIIPTFTIMWFYTYVFSKNEDHVIEVKG